MSEQNAVKNSFRYRVFDIRFEEDFRKKFHSHADKIFDNAYLTNHHYTAEFEKRFNSFQFAQNAESMHSLSCSSGTSALELIFRALNVQGSQVLMPANTFIATPYAVINAGGSPVIEDIELEYLSLSPKSVFEQLHKNKNIKAVTLVHIAGVISPHTEEIQRICKQKDVLLIEDCAHAHGASLNGVAAGQFGLAGAFSFHLTKVVTSGEGGMVTTSNSSFAEKIKNLRQFGKNKINPLIHDEVSSNYKMSELQALTGILDLERAPARIAKRQALAKIYQEQLAHTIFQTLKPEEKSFCPYYKQVVTSPLPRSQIQTKLESLGYPLTGGVYNFPLHLQPSMKPYLQHSHYPNADFISANHFCPPCYPEFSEHLALEICDLLKKISHEPSC